LGLKGINFNLNQFLYGYDTIGSGQSSSPKDLKPKLFNAMESEDGHESSQHKDKGKGIDKVNTEGNVGSGGKSSDKDNSAEDKDEVFY